MSANLLRPLRAVATSASRGVRQLHRTSVRNVTFTSTDAVMPKPNPSRITGYLGITVATSMGMFAGAQISKNIASFLEENELFVPSDDDDDD